MRSATEQRNPTGMGLVGGAQPYAQVNLLPPEVRAARGLTTTKRLLALALVGVVVFAGVGWVVATFDAQNATEELVEAQDQATSLAAEEAKYADVPPVVNGLRRAKESRAFGMSTEISWKSYIDAIAAVLPPGTAIETLSVVQGTPSFAAPAPGDALMAQGAATITFTTVSSTLPDASAWITALDTVPGFRDATFSTETLGDANGVTAYQVTSSVQVAESAYAHRFAVEEPTTGATTDTPAPTTEES